MQLPESLIHKIEDLLHGRPFKDLQLAWAEMSEAYRQGQPIIPNELQALAYIIGRAPGTYAAMRRVLELSLASYQQPLRTHLDVGSGPGTAVWAARDILDGSLRSIALDRNPAWRKWAATIAPDLTWKLHECALTPLPKAELVTAGYMLNELPAAQVTTVLGHLWDATEQVLVIVEPGTPAGFERILQARTHLMEAGAHVIAPCPGWTRCPLAGTSNWCHFGVRFNRPRFQKLGKESERGWEDEMFSFLAVSRSPSPHSEGRVMHHPQKRGGHVWVELCTKGEIERAVLSRRQGDLYRAARRAHWGDAWPPAAGAADSEEESTTPL